jgi:hypothetical protein
MELPAEAPPAQKPLHESANNAGVATGSRNDSASESVTRGNPLAAFLEGHWERIGQDVDFVWNGRHRKPRIRQVLRWVRA